MIDYNMINNRYWIIDSIYLHYNNITTTDYIQSSIISIII